MLRTLSHRDFALLWGAGLVSVAGGFALIVALLLHAYALTGSAVAAGGVFAAGVLPRVLLGSVAGVFVDRWDRKRTMVAADLLRALVLLPLLAVDSADRLWVLFLSQAATGTLGLFFGPAETALLPKLVGEERLVEANALNALNNNLGRLVGPVIGGVLYARVGLAGAALADAAAFLLSSALVALIRANGRPDRTGLTATRSTAWWRVVGEWTDGIRLVRGERALRTIFVAFGLGMVGEGAFEVGFTPLVLDTLEGGAAGVGALLSAQAIGGLAAGAAVAAVAARVPGRLLFGGGLVGCGLTDLGLANAANLAPAGAVAVGVACGFMALAGVPFVAMQAASTGLLQQATSDAFRGRVFGALATVDGVAVLAGIAVGGAAVDAVGAVPVLSLGAALWIVGGVVALVALPRRGRGPAPSANGSGAGAPEPKRPAVRQEE